MNNKLMSTKPTGGGNLAIDKPIAANNPAKQRRSGFRLVAMLLTVAMLTCMSTSVMASGAEVPAGEDYVVTYQAEEITDTDALIELALEQSAQQTRGRSTFGANENQLDVSQLLETREYADGRTANYYAETGIIAMDAAGRAIKYQNSSASTSGYGAFLTATTYYTVYESTDPINYPQEYAIEPSHIVANVAYNGGAVQPSYLQFILQYDISGNGNVYCNSSTTQSHTFYLSNDLYFGPTHVLRNQTELFLNNGSSIYVLNIMYNK